MNEDFRALFADGVPALTPLTVKSEGPPSPDPSAASRAPAMRRSRGRRACAAMSPRASTSCSTRAAASATSMACAEGAGLAAVYALNDGIWVSYILGAPEFVNRSFRELFIDGVPSVTPLVAKRD